MHVVHGAKKLHMFSSEGGGVQRVENLNGYWYYICSVSMF